MFGTILGGIWADQSWGRFWGWDPKENGALLIVMWHLLVLHLRITGLAKPLDLAFYASLVNIIVVLAWFGVNLLSVGLHSYGFTDNVALNLFLFIAFELIFCTTLYVKGKIFYFKMKNISLLDAESLLKREINFLEDAVKNSKNSFHLFSLSTVNENVRESRTVVLRGFEKSPFRLQFNTDKRSLRLTI